MAGDLPDVYLQFVGAVGEYTGECMDKEHPGEKGWITIKSINFGFGFPGKDDTPEEKKKKDDKKKDDSKPAKKKTAGMLSGPMTFDPISISKSSDLMSTSLMKACRLGSKIDTVVLHACRAGGTDGAEKLVFLEMTFSEVHLKTCTLNLTTDGLPSEDIQFVYEKVEMKSHWTDNATGGNRMGYGPLSVEWSLAQGQPPDGQSSSNS